MPKYFIPVGAILVISLLLLAPCGNAPAIDQHKNPQVPLLKREDAQFYIFKANEVNDPPIIWDQRNGGMYVIDLAQGLRASFDLARGEKIKLFNQAKTARLSTRGVMIIGRLPGDGTGANHSFITRSLSTKGFSINKNELLLVAEVEFSGPFMDGEPAPQSIYFSTIVQDIPIGKYQMKLQIEPRGEVYEKWKASKDIQLPKYPPMSTSFEIVEQSFSLR
jgi:hypothetical protein